MTSRIYLFVFVFTFMPCSEGVIGEIVNRSSQIKLKWFSSYSNHNFKKYKIVLEWMVSLSDIQIKLQRIVTYVDNEFPFLVTLHHRKSLEPFSSHTTIEPQISFREESIYEPNRIV